MLVTKALCGLRSSGAAFRALLAETLVKLGHKPSHADPDVWMRAKVRPSGFEHHEHVWTHVDDVLSISADPMKRMRGIQEDFKLEDDKIAEPDVCLGATLERMEIDGESCWSM